MMSPDDLKGHGGAPSGKWGSNYTKVCRLLKTVDDMDVPKSYLDKKQREARRALYAAVSGFHPNEPATAVDKKGQEILAVRKLKAEMDTENQMDRAKVSELLDKMATDGMPLVRNTGVALKDLFSKHSGGLSMTFRNVAGANENASFSSSTIIFNMINFWKSENLARGILVHEYHHYLSNKTGGTLYADEFVAHWKQYLAMRKTFNEQLITDLNQFLLVTGYKLQDKKDQPGMWAGVKFTRPEAGHLWTKYRDNVVAAAAAAAG
jgi:hypothetical protein